MPEFDDERPDPPPPEGVRILGAEDVPPATASGPGRARRGSGASRRRRPAPEEPPADPGPTTRFPLPAGRAPGEPPRPAPLAPPAEGTGPIPLPHWTEPPTGEVPQIVVEEIVEEEPWALGAGQPRFRSEAGDWGESDFGAESLHDDTTAMGALVDTPDVDDDAEFAAQVEARRAPARPGSRRRGAARPKRAPGPGASRSPYPTMEEDRDPQVAPTRDDLPTRVVTAAIMAAVALLAFVIGRAGTAVLITVIVAAAAFELFDGFRRAGFQPATIIGLLGSLSMVGIAYNYGESAFPLVGAIVLGFTLFWYLAKVVHARPMVNAAVTMLGFGYVGVLGGFAGLLLAVPDGVGIIIGLALCAVAYDVVGYFVGSRMGRRPLAPDVSPNKTVEGLIAGMIASVFIGALVATFELHPWVTLGDGLLLGIVVAVFAPLGDLVESMLKRDLGLKDFGTILPGHGGVLDRFDAMLFCLPAVYYLVIARGIF